MRLLLIKITTVHISVVLLGVHSASNALSNLFLIPELHGMWAVILHIADINLGVPENFELVISMGQFPLENVQVAQNFL